MKYLMLLTLLLIGCGNHNRTMAKLDYGIMRLDCVLILVKASDAQLLTVSAKTHEEREVKLNKLIDICADVIKENYELK